MKLTVNFTASGQHIR